MTRKLSISLHKDNITNLVIEEIKTQKPTLKKSLLKMSALETVCMHKDLSKLVCINVCYFVEDDTLKTETPSAINTKSEHANHFLQNFVSDVLRILKLKRSRLYAPLYIEHLHQGWPTCLRLGSSRNFFANSRSAGR